MDQIKLGLEVLSRIESELHAPPPEETSLIQRPTGLPYNADNPPSLHDLIEDMGPLPPASMIIGACEDRSHLFLELTEPQPGSLLILGEAHSGKSRLLHSMLASLAAVNSPRHVRYALICDLDPEVQALIEQPHCYRHHWPNAVKSGDFIVNLADLVENRQVTHQNWGAVVLAIDDLSSFLSYQDDETIAQLTWLITNGPEVGVWTIATLNASEYSSLDSNLAEAFGTRLLGKINESELAEEISGSTLARPNHLHAGSQFGVVFGDEWIPFWVPTMSKTPSNTQHLQKELSYGYRNAMVR